MNILTEEQQYHYSTLSPAAKKLFLKSLMEETSADEPREALAKVLFELEDEDAKYSAMDKRSTHEPQSFDVLITDISEADFQLIGQEMGIVRLSKTAPFHPTSYPIYGIMYGPTLRVFIPLVVTKKTISVHVCFLFDTGSPNTYLREDTFQALGYMESTPSSTMVSINGVGLTVYLSRGHFENVDLIGQDCMAFLGGKVSLDYIAKTAQLDKSL